VPLCSLEWGPIIHLRRHIQKIRCVKSQHMDADVCIQARSPIARPCCTSQLWYELEGRKAPIDVRSGLPALLSLARPES
jgi:hypothetical protein